MGLPNLPITQELIVYNVLLQDLLKKFPVVPCRGLNFNVWLNAKLRNTNLPYTIFQKWRVKSIRKNAVPQLPEQSSLKVVKLVKKKSVIGSLREFLNLSINRTAETKRRKYVALKKRPSPNRSRNTLIRRWVSIPFDLSVTFFDRGSPSNLRLRPTL